MFNDLIYFHPPGREKRHHAHLVSYIRDFSSVITRTVQHRVKLIFAMRDNTVANKDSARGRIKRIISRARVNIGTGGRGEEGEEGVIDQSPVEPLTEDFSYQSLYPQGILISFSSRLQSNRRDFLILSWPARKVPFSHGAVRPHGS